MAGARSPSDIMSYLTSHAYGSGDILPVEGFSGKAQSKAQGFPSIESKPAAASPRAKNFTPAGIASTLSFRAGGKSKKSSSPSTSSFELSNSDIDSIIETAENVWRSLASEKMQGKALQEYTRSMRVEWKNNSLSLKLEGWEAASRELGWAPTSGGLDGGLGKYDGTLHDLKPIVLGGKSKRVIPLKLEGTQSSFESMIRDSSLSAKTAKVKSMISDDVSDAMAAKPGEQVRQSRTSPGRKAPAQNSRSRSGFGKRITLPGESSKTLVSYTRSPLAGAVKAADHRGGALGSDGTFISFRTMVADGYTESNAPNRRKFKMGASKKRLARMMNDRSKWWTAGRAPYQLMEAVLDSMRGVIARKLASKRAEFLQEQLSEFAKSIPNPRYEELTSTDGADDISDAIAKVFQNAMSYLSNNTKAASPKRRK
jgi:hypothetical protein